MMKLYQKEYESYVKEIVDKFSDMCAVKRDYTDYCNCIQGKNLDTHYNFRQADGRTLIDMLISGKFEREDVHRSITERQELAKKWLSENLLTYDEWNKIKRGNYYPEPTCCICGNICKTYEIHKRDEQMWCWCEKCHFDTFHNPIGKEEI